MPDIDLDPFEIVATGNLYKRHNVRSAWLQRKGTLCGQYLYQYSKSDVYRGKFLITDCTVKIVDPDAGVVPPGFFGFVLVGAERSVTFCVSTKKELISWITVLHDQVVEFKDELRPHLRRGELVVGNNFVRVVKSPESYDSTESWCDGSVSVRLIVTTFPRFFFVDLPSDLDPKPQENICCTPSFVFPELSTESFFSVFYSGTNADKSSTSTEILEARRRAARQMSKEQKSWDNSSHPTVIEMSGDSLEVCFFFEQTEVIRDESKHSDDTASEAEEENSAETYARFNTYIFIDEINGSKYWFNVFADLRRIRLMSTERILQSTVIGKESKRAAARSSSTLRHSDDLRGDSDFDLTGTAESTEPGPGSGSAKELVYPGFTQSPDFIDGETEQVSQVLPFLRLEVAEAAPRVGALSKENSAKIVKEIGPKIATLSLHSDTELSGPENSAKQQEEGGPDLLKEDLMKAQKSRGSVAGSAALTSLDSLKAYLKEAQGDIGVETEAESMPAALTSIDSVKAYLEEVQGDIGVETVTAPAAVVVTSIDAAKVDLEKIQRDRGSETRNDTVPAPVVVTSIDVVKVNVEKIRKERGSETVSMVIDTGLVKANLKKVQREVGSETDAEAETRLESAKANLRKVQREIGLETDTGAETSLESAKSKLRKVQREMGAGSDADPHTEGMARCDSDVEEVHGETGSGSGIRRAVSAIQSETNDLLLSDPRQRDSVKSGSSTPGYTRAKVISSGYDAATLALLASLRIRGSSDADIAELLKLHQLQRRAEWSKSPSPGDLTPEYATLEELAKRQTDVSAVVACLAEYEESTVPEPNSPSKAPAVRTRPGLPLGPHILDVDAAQGHLERTLGAKMPSNLSFRDDIPDELIVPESEEPLLVRTRPHPDPHPHFHSQASADSADDQGRLGMHVGRDLIPGRTGRQTASAVPGHSHAVGIAEGGVAETRCESSAMDLNIRDKVESRGIRYPDIEKMVAHKAEKDIFVRNWDDESYKLLSSGMEIESENSSVNPQISSKAVSSQKLSSEAESISTKSSARTGEDSPSYWDEDGNRRFSRGMFRGTGEGDDVDEVVMFGVDRTHSHSIKRDLGLRHEESSKRLTRGVFRGTGDATAGDDTDEVVMFGVDRTQSLSIRRDLGQGQGVAGNGIGKVFVENFDHGAYERCGSGIFREKLPSGGSSPNSREDRSEKKIPPLMMPSSSSSSLTNSAAPSPMSPNYANSFSSKAIFTSQIMNNRKTTPRGDEEALASTSNSHNAIAQAGAQATKPFKRSKLGKPRPKSINDEIPFPSLKDAATLAKWKLDRPVSISRNGHNLGPYDDDMPPEVADTLTRRLASCDEFDDEEEDDDEDDGDDMDDIPEVRRVHVEEGVTMERVKAIGQGMPRGTGAGPGLGSAKGFSTLEEKAEVEKGGDRESGKSFLLSESECSDNEIERAMSVVDDSHTSQGRLSRGGSKSSILGLGLGSKGSEAADDPEDSLEVEIASRSADDAGQVARKQSMFSQFFRKIDPSRRKSYNAAKP